MCCMASLCCDALQRRYCQAKCNLCSISLVCISELCVKSCTIVLLETLQPIALQGSRACNMCGMWFALLERQAFAVARAAAVCPSGLCRHAKWACRSVSQIWFKHLQNPFIMLNCTTRALLCRAALATTGLDKHAS